MVEPRESEIIESSTVKETHVTSKTTANMKSYLSLALFALVATLLLTTEIHASELCPKENCLSPNKCEEQIVGGQCASKSDSCCSIVKTEFRTHCRHHGGECMKKCSSSLTRDTVDCAAGTVCCVLV